MAAHGRRFAAYDAVRAWAHSAADDDPDRFWERCDFDDGLHEIVFHYGCGDPPPFTFADGGSFWSLTTALPVRTTAGPELCVLLNALNCANVLDRWAVTAAGAVLWSMWAPYAATGPPAPADVHAAASIAVGGIPGVIDALADAQLVVAETD